LRRAGWDEEPKRPRDEGRKERAAVRRPGEVD
jgi:hypothetical protein